MKRSSQFIACPDGPMLVRGASTVKDADGDDHDVTRPVVAICRCGKSALGVWCDGTHKVLRRPLPDRER